MIKVGLSCLLLFLLNASVAHSSELPLIYKLPLESRPVTWVDMGSYKIPLDEKPVWKHNSMWQGDKNSRVFVTETPKNFYPRATFNAQHFTNQKAPENAKEFKVFASSAIKSVAKNYGHNGRHIKGIEWAKKGQLQGYQVVVDGKIDGKRKDVVIYIATAPDKSIFSLVAFTEPNKSQHLVNTFDRMAINIEFPGGTLGRF